MKAKLLLTLLFLISLNSSSILFAQTTTTDNTTATVLSEPRLKTNVTAKNVQDVLADTRLPDFDPADKTTYENETFLTSFLVISTERFAENNPDLQPFIVQLQQDTTDGAATRLSNFQTKVTKKVGSFSQDLLREVIREKKIDARKEKILDKADKTFTDSKKFQEMEKDSKFSTEGTAVDLNADGTNDASKLTFTDEKSGITFDRIVDADGKTIKEVTTSKDGKTVATRDIATGITTKVNTESDKKSVTTTILGNGAVLNRSTKVVKEDGTIVVKTGFPNRNFSETQVIKKDESGNITSDRSVRTNADGKVLAVTKVEGNVKTVTLTANSGSAYKKVISTTNADGTITQAVTPIRGKAFERTVVTQADGSLLTTHQLANGKTAMIKVSPDKMTTTFIRPNGSFREVRVINGGMVQNIYDAKGKLVDSKKWMANNS